VLIAVERHGPVRAVPIASEKVSEMQPIVDRILSKSAHLMSDGHRSYVSIGKQFTAHSHVNHSAESFSSILERARIGVFHHMSPKHLRRYLNEFEFRWENRVPVEEVAADGKTKTVMKKIPIMDMIILMIMRCAGYALKRTRSWGLMDIAFN
jgi:hypothetical protein